MADARRVMGLVVVLLPVVAVLVTRVGRSYFPVQDRASIDLWVRDVFGSHTPLVGAYSRGFNHPGPLLFYALAPLSKLTGGATWATLVGAALVQPCCRGCPAAGWSRRRHRCHAPTNASSSGSSATLPMRSAVPGATTSST